MRALRRRYGHAVIDPMLEVLLTVWALQQEPAVASETPMSHAFPKRLMGTLRKARKLGYVELDDKGLYLDDLGSAYLIEHAPGVRL